MTHKLVKSKFKPGDTVYARTHRSPNRSVIIKLIKYIPNYEWLAEYDDIETGDVKRHYFDEREFD